MKNPLIGITCNILKDVPDTVRVGIGAPGQVWQLLADDYVRSVRLAGGVPLILPVEEDPAQSEPLLAVLDGLLLSGGNDVTPMLYGERIGCRCGVLDPQRDAFELALTRSAIDRDLPLLCICRGVQILNVAQGGTLYQDLPSSGFELHAILTNERDVPTHEVLVNAETPLFEMLGREEVVWVNSFHHQALREVAPALRAAATSRDGVVEAVDMPGRRFVLATQWHPEMMLGNRQQAAIFEAFVAACRQYSKGA